jgi:carboxypeptidase family protein
MKRIAIGSCALLLISLLCGGTAFGQATAQISGTVRDQSGAVLPGVEVTATQTETGVARSTVSNETGSYALPNLAVGPYKLEAALPGFRTFVQTGIVLQVNASPVVNPVLEVGQVSEQVEVQANAAMVETRTSSVGAVIENQRILELPLNGRNVTDLITLSGGAVQLGGGTLGGRTGGGGPTLQIAGGLAYAVDYSLDGANHLNTIQGSQSLQMPFPDALQEFKVGTSGAAADQGRAGGVSAVTKSGTNQFHGDAFEFVRNDLFNARNYFATKGSTLKRHQFGGTVGGPIRKDKLFFFAGYQRTTIRQDPSDLETWLPTPAMLAGDWTTFASAGCNGGRPLTLRAPFANNRIDPAAYSRTALNLTTRILAASPAPEDACGHVRFGRPNKSDTWEAIGRIDFQWSDKHSLFGRYYAPHIYTPTAYSLTPNNVLNTPATGTDALHQYFAFGSTYLVGPNTVNSFRFSANRVKSNVLGPEAFSACDAGANFYCGYAPKRTNIAITNGPSVGSAFATGDGGWQNAFNINDDVSLIRGNHQIALGINPRLAWAGLKDNFIDAPKLNFNGSITGHGLSDFMTGKLFTLTAGGPYYLSEQAWGIAGYAADTWKATPKLTMNYGLRWEPYLPWNMLSGQNHSFDYNRFKQGIKSTVFPNAPAGWNYPGDPGFPGKTGVNKVWGQFGPRVGLAWDVSGDGHTSVRLSYSYSYSYVGPEWREDFSQQNPWANGTQIRTPAGGLDDPWRGIPGGNPFPIIRGAGAQFTQGGDYSTTPYDLQTPRTSSWNLSLQRQIGSDLLVSAAYIGNLTTHIWIQDEINPATYLPQASCTLAGVTYTPCSSDASTNARRRFALERPQDPVIMGNVASTLDAATMNYSGLLLTAQRRVAKGINVNANYTWSHCIGDAVDLTAQGPDAGETFTSPGNRTFDRGDCNGDRRQIFNLTSVAQTPQFANPTLRKVASSWTLSGIYRRSSGSPLNILAGTDRALNGVQGFIQGQQYQRGSQISAKAYGDQSGGPMTNWLDRTAFDIPALGTLGNFRRNSVIGPPSWSFDVALSRSFSFRESQRMEFRAEAFNLTNSFRPLNPANTLTSGTFGQIRTAGDPRILQFALKYVF